MTDAGRIVEIARSWVGTPFHHQASIKGVGCDCLGLLLGIWRDVYKQESTIVPVYERYWARDSSQDNLRDGLQLYLVPAATQLRAGQVILFRWRQHWAASHVAIASSPLTLIHAQDNCGVCEVAIPVAWQKRISDRFEFPPI